MSQILHARVRAFMSILQGSPSMRSLCLGWRGEDIPGVEGASGEELPPFLAILDDVRSMMGTSIAAGTAVTAPSGQSAQGFAFMLEAEGTELSDWSPPYPDRDTAIAAAMSAPELASPEYETCRIRIAKRGPVTIGQLIPSGDELTSHFANQLAVCTDSDDASMPPMPADTIAHLGSIVSEAVLQWATIHGLNTVMGWSTIGDVETIDAPSVA